MSDAITRMKDLPSTHLLGTGTPMCSGCGGLEALHQIYDVLGENTVRVAVEAAASLGWERYIGADGGFVGMSGFGASAPAADLFEHFNITAAAVAEAALARLG